MDIKKTIKELDLDTTVATCTSLAFDAIQLEISERGQDSDFTLILKGVINKLEGLLLL